MLTLFEHHPLLLISALLLVGALLGQFRIASASLGPAAVLFVALGLTAYAGTRGITLEVPEILGSFGLVLFTYAIGISSGPSFFGSLKRGWPVMLSTVGIFAVVGVIAHFIGSAMGLPRAVIAGTYAGALTNTPALAAAGQAAGSAELPAVGYSISYLWGVVGMILAASFALSRQGAARTRKPRLEQRTVRIDRHANPTISELTAEHPGVTVSRVHQEGGVMEVADPRHRMLQNELISVIGEPDAIAAVVDRLGHVSSHDIIGDRTFLDSNRVTLSVAAYSGKRISQLELRDKFGAQVSRVRRGDVDMVVTDHFRVQSGDRLRVVAPHDQMVAIRQYLGDSERGFSDINPAGLALGLTIGVAIGLIQIPLPSGSFTLGSAAGTLVVGLIFGRLARIGRLPVGMPSAASHAISSIGMLVFLAYAGTRAGAQLVDAVTSDLGWKIALLGFIITCAAALMLLIAGRLQKTDWVRLSGQLAGSQTQPAVMAFANTRTDFDNRVALGYALVYPAAMVGKILLTQALVLL